MEKRFDLRFFNISESNWDDMTSQEWMEIIKNKLGDSIGIDKLPELLEENRPLVVKFGIDPTAANIHIGHVVPMMLVKAFLKKGHDVKIVIGDFTARIGDPSGRSTERAALTNETIMDNLKTYKEQIGMFVNLDKVEICLNSNWINKLTPADLFGFLQMISLTQATQRKDFKTRIENGSSVSLAEVCYGPLMGIDSFVLNADIEIGGVDQLLNFMQCRDIMEKKGMKPEIALMTPILEGTSNDGRKMSKSFGNAIAVLEDDEEKFGKFMSISDDLILPYFKCFAFINDSDLAELDSFVKAEPNEAKKQLATFFIAMQHRDMNAGETARLAFERKFSTREFKDEDFIKVTFIEGETMFDLLCRLNLGFSNSEVRRLFQQSGIKTTDKKTTFKMDDKATPGDVRIGKRCLIRIIA